MRKKYILFCLVFFIVISLFLVRTLALSSTSNNGFNLTINDSTEGDNNYKYSGRQVEFYADFINSTTGSVISDGNCSARFNYTDSGVFTQWYNMSYNNSLSLFEYNSTFNYKGSHIFEVNCSNNSQSINITDNFTISNTMPIVSTDEGGIIDFDGDDDADTLQCTEDTLCSYNFSANVTDPDVNDVLIYTYDEANTTLTNFTLNSSTGILKINITHNDYTGDGKEVRLEATDDDNTYDWGDLIVDITAVNDAPYFLNLNTSHNWSESENNVTFSILGYDEEGEAGETGLGGYPLNFSYNITACDFAEWSSKTDNVDCDDLIINNITQGNYTFNITLNRTNDLIGVYNITFNVSDGSLNNLTNTTFEIVNVNDAPEIVWSCNDTRNGTEDSLVSCWINATDTDEANNFTFSSSHSWFQFNNSNDSIVMPVSNNNASALINFTPSDSSVGNWSINITVSDSDLENPGNTTTSFWFYISNVNDSVSLTDIDNLSAYQNNSYSISVNATDEDFLINTGDDDSIVFNESLDFALTNHTSGGNVTWINIITGSITNDTQEVFLNFTAEEDLAGEHILNFSVNDSSDNKDSKLFNITIFANNLPVWNVNKTYEFYTIEDNETYINISSYVNDSDGDSISFSNASAFPNFNLTSSGVINFTPSDIDIGFYEVEITASDGKTPQSHWFNFTINNTNDSPIIESVKVEIPSNGAITGGVEIMEDDLRVFNLTVRDDDLLIPEDMQEEYYDENLTINITILNVSYVESPLSFNFSFYSTSNNLSYYKTGEFTPNNSNVGNYTVFINATDESNNVSSTNFSLNVTGVNDDPVLMNLTNKTSAVNRDFYYRINATDQEDGDSTVSGHNLTFSYDFLSGDDIFNTTTFNSTTGEINITFNSTHGGKYRLNISVNDTENSIDSDSFWIYVYDSPNISFHEEGYNFTGLEENVSSELVFTVNHSVGDNLTYVILIDNIVYSNSTNYTYGNFSVKSNMSYYGNATNRTWNFTPNFTDETYGMYKNITLRVYPSNSNLSNRTLINSTRNWNINISHTNHPFTFNTNIPNQSSSYNDDITIELEDYFLDYDFLDSYYNQSVNFSLETNASISHIESSFTNQNLTLSATIATVEEINITGSDANLSNDNLSLTDDTSNTFRVEFTEPDTETETVTTPSSGGGGGGRDTVLLKLVFPEELSFYKGGRVTLPITLKNGGEERLTGINLYNSISKDGVVRDDLFPSFNTSYFDSLSVGDEEKVLLTIPGGINETGVFELFVNATVDNPDYYDWERIYLNIKELDANATRDEILFTEEFIASNPECLEIKEVVERAWELYEVGDYEGAIQKTKEAITACEESVAQVNLPDKKESKIFTLQTYFLIFVSMAFILGLFYYFYKRSKAYNLVVDEGKV